MPSMIFSFELTCENQILSMYSNGIFVVLMGGSILNSQIDALHEIWKYLEDRYSHYFMTSVYEMLKGTAAT